MINARLLPDELAKVNKATYSFWTFAGLAGHPMGITSYSKGLEEEPVAYRETLRSSEGRNQEVMREMLGGAGGLLGTSHRLSIW